MTRHLLLCGLVLGATTLVGCEHKEEPPKPATPSTPAVPTPPPTPSITTPSATTPAIHETEPAAVEPTLGNDAVPSDEPAAQLRAARDAVRTRNYSKADEILESLEARKIELTPEMRQQVDAARTMLDAAKKTAATGTDGTDGLAIPQPPLDTTPATEEPMK